MLRNDIKVVWENIYEDCSHDGCSGPEIVTITATKQDKTVTVSGGSCFGVDKEQLIAELLEKWDHV